MNCFSTRENRLIKEKYLYTTHESGMKIILVPKSFPTQEAFLSCDFGAADTVFFENGELFTLPAGTAHFLEHKMFEQADGSDSFAEFDTLGGNANAYTSYENTCFYFGATDNFYENLEVLLRSVGSFHVSAASVEKERAIIGSEIKMYDDRPETAVSRGLTSAMYFEHPTVMPISGTEESISLITPELLGRVYKDFYLPQNLSLCVCGEADAQRVYELVGKYFAPSAGSRPETVIKPEGAHVKEERRLLHLPVATPLYAFGIKLPPDKADDIAAEKRAAAIRTAVSLAFGRASEFYCRYYSEGLLGERFWAGYSRMRGMAHITVSGSGKEPERVMELALRELEERKKSFFTHGEFLREKRAAYADCLSVFDSGEDIASVFASDARRGYDEYDCIEILRSLTEEDVFHALCAIDINNSAICIAENAKGKDKSL